jgi:hypothetical protein
VTLCLFVTDLFRISGVLASFLPCVEEEEGRKMDSKMAYLKKRQPPGFDPTQQMASSRDTMMRIAIAGSGGLARIIAYNIEQTQHQFVILSRYVSASIPSKPQAL